ncbi:amidohydrolase [Facklamia tabacinasalis]|uniref:Amidohydrolase n=2 Tax=Ruoffia tabacinasalis TaxID=87458 RepID=A0ABS0LGB2_9LACT|nr:amidohydrolase [Ruoffia tabacinasalis]
MIAFRRELHQYPELSMEEYETTKRIARELDKVGLSYKFMEPTGLVGEIVGGKPDRTVLLRADIDALPIYEVTRDLEYCSKNDGVMHACGHDTHASMLLTALKALNKEKADLQGTVRFVFQPSEENGQGALKMIEQGVTEGADNVFGIHIQSGVRTGVVMCPEGEMMASHDLLTVNFTGKGGHAARPEKCVDAAVMASSFVMNAQAVVAREMSPIESVVVTIGKMEVGDRFNVIAERAHLEGTVRTFNPVTREKAETALKRYAQAVASMYGGTVEFGYQHVTQPVSNDVASAQRVQGLASEFFGEENVVKQGKTTGGEDFSFYMVNGGLPGAFAVVGAQSDDEATHYEHHHNKFNVDEAALKNGARVMAEYAYRYLNN